MPARVFEVSDIGAQHIAAAENFQREDYTAVESTEAIVKIGLRGHILICELQIIVYV